MIRSVGWKLASAILGAFAWTLGSGAPTSALHRTALDRDRVLPLAVLATVEGTVEPRPFAEEGVRPRKTWLVAMTDSPLRNTYWKLVRLGGAPVEVAEHQREPHLIFALHEMHVSGSGGCNRIAGPFDLDGEKLHLRRLASTRMACPSGMDQEDRFLRALETVERYAVRGSRLDLLGAAGTVVAEFEAVALR